MRCSYGQYLKTEYHILTAAMKADRKRLKAEKLDLLSQMKQLYCTLEDKESELRDFIRNYEQRMRESDIAVKQVGSICCNYIFICDERIDKTLRCFAETHVS